MVQYTIDIALDAEQPSSFTHSLTCSLARSLSLSVALVLLYISHPHNQIRKHTRARGRKEKKMYREFFPCAHNAWQWHKHTIQTKNEYTLEICTVRLVLIFYPLLLEMRLFICFCCCRLLLFDWLHNTELTIPNAPHTHTLYTNYSLH